MNINHAELSSHCNSSSEAERRFKQGFKSLSTPLRGGSMRGGHMWVTHLSLCSVCGTSGISSRDCSGFQESRVRIDRSSISLQTAASAEELSIRWATVGGGAAGAPQKTATGLQLTLMSNQSDSSFLNNSICHHPASCLHQLFNSFH